MSSEAEQKLSIMQKEAVITVSWCSKGLFQDEPFPSPELKL